MGGKTGGLGMRVNGRSGVVRKGVRANSSTGVKPVIVEEGMGRVKGPQVKMMEDGFFSPSNGNVTHRPRSDSAPLPGLLAVGGGPVMGSSMLTTGRGLGVGGMLGSSVLEQALSGSEYTSDENVWRDAEGDGEDEGEGEGEESSMGLVTIEGGTDSVMPSDLGLTVENGVSGEEGLVDEGSDVDEEEMEEDKDDMGQRPEGLQHAGDSKRSSIATWEEGHLEFKPIPVVPKPTSNVSALTAALNKHVPHLVSTSSSNDAVSTVSSNPFASLYASVAAPSAAPSLELEIYFPHSKKPSKPLVVKVRKDATVEEATGFGLYKYWEEGREPKLSEEAEGPGLEDRWSTVGWGLRIVEDDGEVDEDFPRRSSTNLTHARSAR
jgi:hypothetical protein